VLEWFGITFNIYGLTIRAPGKEMYFVSPCGHAILLTDPFGFSIVPGLSAISFEFFHPLAKPFANFFTLSILLISRDI
jgi:hypothetical protein